MTLGEHDAEVETGLLAVQQGFMASREVKALRAPGTVTYRRLLEAYPN